MPRKLITGPAVEPVTLQEVKAQLRMEPDFVEEDMFLSSLILAAREEVESFTGRALVTQVWDVYRDRFPIVADFLRLPLPPLQSVESVRYIDAQGVQRTLSPDVYAVDSVSEPGRVVLKYGCQWPSDTLAAMNPIVIRFTAGYPPEGENLVEGIPQRLKHAMLLLVSHWYETRQPVSVENAIVPREIPYTVERLLNAYRVEVPFA